MASSQYDKLIKDFDVRNESHHSHVGIVGSWIWSTCLVPGQDASGPRDDCIHATEMEHFAKQNLSVAVAKILVLMVWGAELRCV